MIATATDSTMTIAVAAERPPMKAKQLTNFRASGGKDDAIRLTPPKKMTLEQAIAYIDDDELVEVTPKSIRLRKRFLDPHERKRASRAKAAA